MSRLTDVASPCCTLPQIIVLWLKLPHPGVTSFSLTYIVKHKKVSKGAKIRNRYNQVPDLPQDTNGKVANSQLDTTNESQGVSPFPAGDHLI